VCAPGTVRDRIELSGLHIVLKLPVPDPGVELGEPVSEVAQFIVGQGLNFVLNLFDFGHRFD
jgi:hypothetical protein